MVNEIHTGLGIFKAMLDVAKGLKDTNDVAARNRAVIELQEKLFTAREQYAALTERIRELEERVAEFEAWDGEKERYQLKQVGIGAFAYSPKPVMKGAEPEHWLCTQCFGNRKKSFLQARARIRREAHTTYHCSVCQSEISVSYTTAPGKNGNSRTIKV